MKKPPSNPYLTWCFVLSGATIGIGIILLIVGVQMEADQGFFSDGAAGLAQMQAGNALLGYGFIALVISLAAAAVTWKPAKTKLPR